MGVVRKALVALAAVPAALAAQAGTGELARAFELERAGRYEDAATRYIEALDSRPSNLSALLGLERVLPHLGTLPTLVPRIDTALVEQPQNRSLRALHLRVLGNLEDETSLEAAARGWMRAMPRSADPYIEWGRALTTLGDAERARRVLNEGLEALDDPQLSQDLAALLAAAGQWREASERWREAVTRNPTLMGSATANLAATPQASRGAVINVLIASPDDSVGSRIAADLLLSWGRPLQAWPLLDRVLPTDRQTAVALLRRFADRARLTRSDDGMRARGFALERLARLSDGAAAERARVEAARAFVDAGDRTSAERMLQRIAGEGETGQRSATAAMVTLITVMAESDRLDEAEERFAEWAPRLSPADRADVRDRIVWARIRRGDLARARAILGPDSTVAGFAARGWIALFSGHLTRATEFFSAAGPRGGSREEATQRTEMLALMQQVEQDSVPQLGLALLELARGDTALAIEGLEAAAATLPAQGGRGGVLALAGRLAVDHGRAAEAEHMLVSAFGADPGGPSAAMALFHLGRAYLELDQPDAAREKLEDLILNHPRSALLPMARRLLDQMRGAERS